MKKKKKAKKKSVRRPAGKSKTPRNKSKAKTSKAKSSMSSRGDIRTEKEFPGPGDMAPDFALPSDAGADVRLSQLRGKHVVLYFYPKDMTPGCTVQACDFSASKAAFTDANCEILGVSRDTVEKHQQFQQKYGLKFRLLSDVDGKVCMAYGVWKEKSLYGKKFMGIERTTFLIGPDGRVEKRINKVKVDGHAESVLELIAPLE